MYSQVRVIISYRNTVTTFKNMIKTMDMNSIKSTFTKYQGVTTTGKTEPINSIGHYMWTQPESADYIVPYFLTTWVTPPKWEAIIRYVTTYRVKRQGFKIDNIIAGKWMTKNNEEVFIPNPLPYFELYVNKDNYIGYRNLRGITKVPNKKFTEIQPMIGTDAELPKYKYSYGWPIHLLNNLPNSTSQVMASNLQTEIPMIDLHDWREMDNIVKLRQLHYTKTGDVHSGLDDDRN